MCAKWQHEVAAILLENMLENNFRIYSIQARQKTTDRLVIENFYIVARSVM